MDEYREAIRQFHELYEPLRKRYGLRCHTYFSMYGENLIEIWEYTGEVQGRCICRASEEDETACYRMAVEDLKMYKKDREDGENGTVADMAV